MRQVAAAHGQAMRGVVACRTVSDMSIRVALFKLDLRTDGWQITLDGTPMRFVLVRGSLNGNETDEKGRKEAEKKTNDDFVAGKNQFRAPYDPRFVRDYDFAAAPSPSGGQRAIRFTSRVRDEHHGDGTVILDESDALVQATVTPAKPKDNLEGATRYEFRSVGPGGAPALTELNGAFKGGNGPVKGTLSLKQVFGQYRRFPSLETALGQLGR